MNELQALVTGMIAGSLMREGIVDVEISVDENGDYKPEVFATGRKSRTRLRISVAVEDEDTS